jgi:hypothetical protein
MTDPEPWQTNAVAPFLVTEKPRGAVNVWSLGRERFRVEAPCEGSEVEGYDQARARKHTGSPRGWSARAGG